MVKWDGKGRVRIGKVWEKETYRLGLVMIVSKFLRTEVVVRVLYLSLFKLFVLVVLL